jgi:hypothetical protein
MKLNKKKISALLGVGLISALTFGPTLNTQADFTPPTGWTFKYTYEDSTVYKIRAVGQTGVFATPTYSRTSADGYFSYKSTFPSLNNIFVSMEFQRSNTSWSDSGNGNYVPSSNPVGSNSNVGPAIKFEIIVSNQSERDYKLFLDLSDTPNAILGGLKYEDEQNLIYYFTAGSSGANFYIPAYTQLAIGFGTTSSVYFSAFYLTDIGQNLAYTLGLENDNYQAGFQAGFDSINAPNTLLIGFQAMVGILVNFALMILNLNVFGVSLLNIFGILALFVGLIWILKIVRG